MARAKKTEGIRPQNLDNAPKMKGVEERSRRINIESAFSRLLKNRERMADLEKEMMKRKGNDYDYLEELAQAGCPYKPGDVIEIDGESRVVYSVVYCWGKQEDGGRADINFLAWRIYTLPMGATSPLGVIKYGMSKTFINLITGEILE
jgi:hypothetical protein